MLLEELDLATMGAGVGTADEQCCSRGVEGRVVQTTRRVLASFRLQEKASAPQRLFRRGVLVLGLRALPWGHKRTDSFRISL